MYKPVETAHPASGHAGRAELYTRLAATTDQTAVSVSPSEDDGPMAQTDLRSWNLLTIGYPVLLTLGAVGILQLGVVQAGAVVVAGTLLVWLKRPWSVSCRRETVVFRVLPLWLRGIEIPADALVVGVSQGTIPFRPRDRRRLPVFARSPGTEISSTPACPSSGGPSLRWLPGRRGPIAPTRRSGARWALGSERLGTWLTIGALGAARSS